MKFYDDDMDELFNKAGRDYHLKTDPNNWEKVRAILHPEDGTAGVTQKRNGWKGLLPFLLLLLIPAVYVFIDKDNTVGKSQEDVKANVRAVTKNETGTTNSQNERTIRVNDRVDLKISDQTKTGNRNNQVNNSVIDINNEKPVERRNSILINSSNRKMDQSAFGEKKASHNIAQDQLALWSRLPSLSATNFSLNQPSEAISLNTPVRSLNQSIKSTSVPNSDKKPKANNKNGFYIGLITAPDISTIKGQEVKGIGYSAGAIAGYTINKRWQVEAGVLWSRKKYYTDGKYFDKKGPGIPDNVNLLWLNGGCEMFEFPVVARYNFSQKKNTFFASAGLTSYMMKKEDYNYSAVAGVGGYPYEGYRKYDRSGDHLFANLQLSAGYNFSITPKLNFRIEPYLKAPLKKIGIGKMPVTSTGLYFGITRDFR